MRIVRIEDCPSLSGRSTLIYHIGIGGAGLASTANPELHLRIFANTAKGFFCKDWISLTLLDLLLTEAQTFASSTVQRMFFEGKSVNSGGFVVAALRSEGLVRAIPGSLRSYERLDPAAWQQEIAALIEAGVSLSENAKPTVAAVGMASVATAKSSKLDRAGKPSGKASPAPVAPVARSSKKASKKTAA